MPSTAVMALVPRDREHEPERMPVGVGASAPRSPRGGRCHAARDPHDGMG